MRKFLVRILIVCPIFLFSQELKITTFQGLVVKATVVDEVTKNKLLEQFGAKQITSLRKQGTARTFMLSNGKVVLEFFDRRAVLLKDTADFQELAGVRFVKNTVDFLKKNISYTITLSFEQGNALLKRDKPKQLTALKSEMPDPYDFAVYQFSDGQILFLDKSREFKKAVLYPDLKTLASNNSTIEEQVYGSDDEEHEMKRLAEGDRFEDYDWNTHFLYPKYLPSLIKNHKLKLVRTNVYVDEFYGNLYKAAGDYYLLVDEVKQKNGAGDKLQILNVRIYETLQEVSEQAALYKQSKNNKVISEHFYQRLSDRYGERFVFYVPRLIDSLPLLLNFDKEQLSFDSAGMDLVDEALQWNGAGDRMFDKWFPAILAYYGTCFIAQKKEGKWAMYYDMDDKVWIPELRLPDGSAAWDWRDFYKDLAEGPVPLRWAGDWDGSMKRVRAIRKADNRR